MYSTLLFLHSVVRWLVLISLFYAVFRAWRGFLSEGVFTKIEDKVRHWTATIAHLQLMIGITLYMISPLIKYLFRNLKVRITEPELRFFGTIHAGLMLVAIVLITVGSGLAKRKEADRDKFLTLLVWYSLALLIILIAIPWPFSIFANRPYFRYF